MFRHRSKKTIFDSEVIFHVLFLLGTEESTITLTITPVWDLIETWGFRVDDPCDFPDSPIGSPIIPHHKFTKPKITQPHKNGDFSQFLCNNSSLGLDRLPNQKFFLGICV